jgi:pilus assembly protein Flp/PilA
MKKMMNWLKNEESGQGMVEYALIIALVGVLLVGALGFLKNQIGTSLNNAGNKVN